MGVRIDEIKTDFETYAYRDELNEKTVSSRLSKCRDKLEIVMRRLFSREKTGAIPSKK